MKTNVKKQARGAKKSTSVEIDESFIAPKLTQKEKRRADDTFRAFREKTEAGRTSHDRLKTQLLQLRFLMEDYLKSKKYDDIMGFGYFLKEYIGRIDKKNNEFAKEINITPTELSQFINSHRAPNDRLIIRLEIHSNNIFNATLWYNIFSKEKTLELIQNAPLRRSEEKQVKKRLAISI
jgi:hypothetical protein